MELPIPRHLKDCFFVYGEDNSENRVRGNIRCTCGCETFAVSSSNRGGLVHAICDKCKKEILLFDAGKHGWDGFVCKSDFLDRTDPMKEHLCPKCGDRSFSVKVTVSSQGKEDFIEECVLNEDGFTAEDWVDGFEWIRISLTCKKCGSAEKAWVDFETM